VAYRINNSATTLTSVTGWDTVTNTPTLHASTNISVINTQIYSATFTAPNTTNAVTGVAVMMVSSGSWASGNQTITCTLQESTVDTVATATITTNTLTTGAYTANTWIYFKFATPYVFTTTGAGAYRFKMTRGSSTNQPTLRSDSGGANFAYMATIDVTGAIATTDDLLVLGHNYADTTVTWDGTQTIGSGLAAASPPTSGVTLSTALYIGAHGIVTADTTASVTTTCKGHVMVSLYGTFNIGSSGTAYPSGKVFTWSFNPTTSGDFSLRSYAGTIEWWGTPKSSTTLYKTTYSSGTGIAADPLLTADAVNWDVNDEVVTLASSDNATNYNELEYKFIKTKNTASSYVLSNTAGGAESAYTYTHNTNAYILNVQRNIIFTTTSSTKAWQPYINNAVVTNASVTWSANMPWVRLENIGTADTTNQQGLHFGGTTTVYNIDYTVFYNILYCGLWGASNTATITSTGVIMVKNTATILNGFIYGQAFANKTFDDLFLLDCGSVQALVLYASSITFNRLRMNAIRKSATPTANAAIMFNIATNCVFNDCEVNASCTAVGFANPMGADNVLNNCTFGTKGKNQGADIAVATTGAYHGALFNNCTFGSNTFWTSTATNNYKMFIAGSKIRFHKMNGTDNNHAWYTPYGIARSTGSGLSDTLVRTPGSLNVRIAPEDSTTGFTFYFKIPASINTTVAFNGFFLKNVAMGTDVCTVSLYLPGNDPALLAPDDTVTLSNNTSNTWTGSAVQAVSLSSYYTGTVDGFAIVAVNAKSTTASAYLYCADFYNSGDTVTLYDKLAGLTIWYQGEPSPVITQLNLGGVAPAVWATATSGLTTPGTTGNNMKKVLTVPKFIGLK